MRIREMQLLVRVAETGSMTQAAGQLGLTPAAVSAAVQRLEEGLGVRLFERTTRALHPTDEGLVVLDGCQAVLARWAQTLEEVQADPGALKGEVHLSAPADTAYTVVAPVLAELSAAHPQLRVVVHPTDALHHLHRDAIDLALRYGALEDSTLTARRLAATPGVLVASPDYVATHGAPERPEALVEHRCVTLQLAGRPVTEWTLRSGETTHTVALRSPLCGDGYLARRWALAGQGIALKSVFDVVHDFEAGRLVRVLPGWQTRPMPIHAVFPSRRFLPARVRAVDAALAARFAERAARCAPWG